MKNCWEMVKLGEVLVSRQIEPDAVKVASGEIPIISKIGFEKGQIELRNDGISNTKLISVFPNDLVLSGINAAKGAISINDLRCQIAATIHYSAYHVKEGEADLNYLLFYLRSRVFQDFLKFESANGLKTEIKPKKFLSFEIPLPPLTEQQRIAGRLAVLKGKMDSVRALRGEQVREVERVENQFLNDLFESLKQRLGAVSIEKVAGLERGRFGYRPRNAPHLYDNGTYPFIQTGEVSRAKGGRIEYSQTLNEEGLKVSRLFKPNTVLMTIAANIGNTAILDFEACFPDSVVSIRPKEGLDIYFLEYYLRTQKDYLNAIAPQSAQKNINVQILSTLKIPVPSFNEQRRIVAEIQAFQTKMEQLKAVQAGQLAGLEGLFPAVLERAFRGEW